MNLINETTDLINRLASIMDDSEINDKYGGIMGIDINSTGAQVHMSGKLFLQSFDAKHYDVICNNHVNEYPYELKREIDGVLYFAVMGPAKVLALKDTHPQHFNYITESLQHE